MRVSVPGSMHQPWNEEYVPFGCVTNNLYLAGCYTPGSAAASEGSGVWDETTARRRLCSQQANRAACTAKSANTRHALSPAAESARRWRAAAATSRRSATAPSACERGIAAHKGRASATAPAAEMGGPEANPAGSNHDSSAHQQRSVSSASAPACREHNTCRGAGCRTSGA